MELMYLIKEDDGFSHAIDCGEDVLLSLPRRDVMVA